MVAFGDGARLYVFISGRSFNGDKPMTGAATNRLPNQASAGDCAVTSWLQVERASRAAPDRHRWMT